MSKKESEVVNKHSFESLIIALSIALQAALSIYVAFFMNGVKIASQSIFLVDLIGKPFFLPGWVFYFCGAFSTLLLWLIGKFFFKGKWSILPALVYSLSFWPAYLVAGQANFIVTLFLGLLWVLSFLRWETNRGSIIWLIISTAALYYFSFFASIVVWLSLLIIILTKVIVLKRPRLIQLITLLVLMYIPVVLGSFYNPEGIINISKQQIKVFSEPGLLNGVNSFKGESQQAGFNLISKFTENKYLFLSEYLLFKTIKNFSLPTFFTPQEKLLNFSFTPPIYLGFIIPFLYGLFKLLKKEKTARKGLLIAFPLIIPSVLAQPFVELNRLILLMPVIVFIISYGLKSIIENTKTKIFKYLLYLIVGLVMIQLVVSLVDISNREYPRFRRFFGPIHNEVGKQ